ncbi:MAG: SDR family oxidoreductase [Pseudomonadota bacterium]
MIISLTGHRVLVTGASSGLGAHFARALSAEGAQVAVAARRVDRLEALVNEISGAGGRAAAIEMDVADARSVGEGVSAAERELGGLTGLVNNAGVAHGGLALETSDEAWRRTMAVNVDGAFRVARRVAQGMIDRGVRDEDPGGAIVNIASILGKRVSNGVAAYCASKAAIDHLTRALALEWARENIRVNALAPGYFPSELTADHLTGESGERQRKMIPMRRFGRLEDLDGPLLLLMSSAGAYMTGATIAVDGGHLVSPL